MAYGAKFKKGVYIIMEDSKNGFEKSQERVGLYTPERTPEEVGQLSTSEWMRRHSSDKPISDDKGVDNGR